MYQFNCKNHFISNINCRCYFVHIQYGSTPYPTSLMVEILLGNRLYPLVCCNSFQLRSSDWQNKGRSLRKQIISSDSDLQPNNNIKIQDLRNSKAEWSLQCCLQLILDSWLHSSATLKIFDFPKMVMNCHQHEKYNIFPLYEGIFGCRSNIFGILFWDEEVWNQMGFIWMTGICCYILKNSQVTLD